MLHRVRRQFRRAGLDVCRYPQGTPEERRSKLLRHFGVSVILDVGANEGQFATEVRALGYEGRIISFEPLSNAAQSLSQRALADPGWTVLQSAVGDEYGSATLYIAANSVSSSLLPILKRHVSAAPESRYVDSEEVPITTLTEATKLLLSSSDRVFLKVDAQGYQRHVLRGAEGIWDLIVGLQVEFSLTPLYEGEMLFHEGVPLLLEQGFSLMGVEPGFTDPGSGRTLQVDAILFRE